MISSYVAKRLFLVGIIIGPSLLGWVEVTSIVTSLATIGAIFLLFVVGLETKFEEIKSAKNVVIALLGVVIPWIGGFLFTHLAIHFKFLVIANPAHLAYAPMFIGTALTATSIAITAHVLKEKGKLEKRKEKQEICLFESR